MGGGAFLLHEMKSRKGLQKDSRTNCLHTETKEKMCKINKKDTN
jgi:hypothetical protein